MKQILIMSLMLILFPLLGLGQNKNSNLTPLNIHPISDNPESNKAASKLIQPKFIDGEYLFEEVVPVKNISKNELFKRAKIWYQISFKNPSKVISSEDIQDGILVLNPGFSFIGKTTTGISDEDYGKCTLTIEFKDGKYRYKFSDIEVATSSLSPGKFNTLNVWKSFAGNINDKGPTTLVDALINGTTIKINSLINSLKDGMSNSSKNDNW